MLVLSRKPHESITLDCGVRIRVVAVNGYRVSLGIEAPDSVRILRTELIPVASDWSEAETPAVSGKHEPLGGSTIQIAK